MKTNQNRNSVPKTTTNPQKTNEKISPSRPGSDPDQTPERETGDPPVAKSNKGSTGGKRSNKIGF